MKLNACALLTVLAVIGLAPSAAAQTDPRMAAAVKLAQDGQADSARAITRNLLTRIPVSDTLYPQALFTAAAVAATSPEMEKALRRIVVEYASSEWVDDALLRLAQLDYAGGDVRSASEKLERLRSDFPNSTLLPQAALWAARSYFELRNQTAACQWLTEGRARAGSDIETGNQIASYQQRCSPGALMAEAPTMDTVKLASGDSIAAPSRAAGRAPVADSTARSAAGRPAVADSTTPLPRVPVGAWRLQLAAMPTAAQAQTLVSQLKTKGIDADVTPDGPYFKVRTGAFPTRAAAAAALPGVQQKAGSAPFIVREGN